MNSKIVETLELMCDKENLQDKKILLLAELVETKCEALSKNQDGLKKSLEETTLNWINLQVFLKDMKTSRMDALFIRIKSLLRNFLFSLNTPKSPHL